jgi:hypothetical protein
VGGLKLNGRNTDYAASQSDRQFEAQRAGARLHHNPDDLRAIESLEAELLAAERRGDAQIVWPPVTGEIEMPRPT